MHILQKKKKNRFTVILLSNTYLVNTVIDKNITTFQQFTVLFLFIFYSLFILLKQNLWVCLQRLNKKEQCLAFAISLLSPAYAIVLQLFIWLQRHLYFQTSSLNSLSDYLFNCLFKIIYLSSLSNNTIFHFQFTAESVLIFLIS